MALWTALAPLLLSTAPAKPLQSLTRRFVVSAPLCALSLALPSRALAARTTYTDEASSVSFVVPPGWSLEKKSLDRSQLPVVIVTKDGSPSTNAFLSVSSIRGDYANLGSFGSPADVLVNLIPPAGTPGIKSQVLASVSKGSIYEFDYTIGFEESGITRHLRTVFGIKHAPAGSDFLVTLTAQAEAQNYASAKAELDAILASIKGF